MSFIIKGLDIPKTCRQCPCCGDNGLVEITTPHGRLIDADKLYDIVEQRYRMSSGIEHRCERDLLDLICGSPTIIEAEVSE